MLTLLLNANAEKVHTPFVKGLFFLASKNLSTSTKTADSYIAECQQKCIKSYFNDGNKQFFSGGYIHLDKKIPFITFYSAMPTKKLIKITARKKRLYIVRSKMYKDIITLLLL